MITTIDDLIARLLELRAEKGNCEIGIDDADTDWHMFIKEAYISDDPATRVLIKGAGYGDGIMPK